MCQKVHLKKKLGNWFFKNTRHKWLYRGSVSVIIYHLVPFFTLCLNKAWHERQQRSYFKLYNVCKFLFIDQWTWLPGVEGSPWSWVSSYGPKHSVCEWAQYEQDSVITFNEGRCWCGVLPLLEQRKDDTHTHTHSVGMRALTAVPRGRAEEWGGQKKERTERKIECNTMEQTDDVSWGLEAVYYEHRILTNTDTSAVNAVQLQLWLNGRTTLKHHFCSNEINWFEKLLKQRPGRLLGLY